MTRAVDPTPRRLRAAFVQIACGSFITAKGRVRLLRREEIIKLARRICRDRGWDFSKPGRLSRLDGGPLPPFTAEQRKFYVKMRRLIGRKAAIEDTLAKF